MNFGDILSVLGNLGNSGSPAPANDGFGQIGSLRKPEQRDPWGEDQVNPLMPGGLTGNSLNSNLGGGNIQKQSVVNLLLALRNSQGSGIQTGGDRPPYANFLNGGY